MPRSSMHRARPRTRARRAIRRCGGAHKGLTKREREKNRRKSSVRAKFEHTFLIIKRTLGFAKVQLSRHGRTASPVRGGTGESVHGSTSSVATFTGKVRLMGGKWAEMAGRIPRLRDISCRLRHLKLNARSSLAFVVTYAELSLELTHTARFTHLAKDHSRHSQEWRE